MVIPRNRTSLVSYSPLREEVEEEGDAGPGKLASGQSEDDDDDGRRPSAAAALVEDRQVRGHSHTTYALGGGREYPERRFSGVNSTLYISNKCGQCGSKIQ